MNIRAHPPEACRRVLLVEDEPRLREMLVGAMEEMHFQPAGCGSGESALRLLEQRPFDLAVIDLNLPGMSGLELFERLKQQFPKIRVIILTGFGDLETARKSIPSLQHGRRFSLADPKAGPEHLHLVRGSA